MKCCVIYLVCLLFIVCIVHTPNTPAGTGIFQSLGKSNYKRSSMKYIE